MDNAYQNSIFLSRGPRSIDGSARREMRFWRVQERDPGGDVIEFRI
jgi:hypothetical protein